MSTLKVNNVQDLGSDDVVVNGVIDSAALPAGSILQVVQAVKTDTATISSTSFVTITGLTATITPSSASSKILILGDVKINEDGNVAGVGMARLMRDSTVIYQGDAAGSRIRGQIQVDTGARTENGTWNPIFLDSPNTTSSVTYSFEALCTAGGPVYVNRTWTDTDNTGFLRGASSITLMEVAG